MNFIPHKPLLDDSYVSPHGSHTHRSEESVPQEATQHSSPNFSNDDGDPHDEDMAAPSFSASGKPVSVPHKKSKAAAVPVPNVITRYASLRQIYRDNFLKTYGIVLTEKDQPDLEHTSCESSDDEAVQAHKKRRPPPVVPINRMDDDESDSFDHDRMASADRSAALANAAMNDADSDFKCRGDRSHSHSRSRRDIFEQPHNDQLDDDDDDEDERESGIVKGRQPPPKLVQSVLAPGGKPLDSSSGTKRARPDGGSKSRMGGLNSVSRVRDCFLCGWGDKRHDSVNNEDMKILLKILNENIGEMGTVFIALAAHKFYKNVIKANAEARGQRLPKWRSREILICIETHGLNPRTRVVSTLSNFSIIQSALENRLFIEVTGANGEKSFVPNLSAFKLYFDVVKIDSSIRKLDLTKLVFHKSSENASEVGGSRWKGITIERKRVDNGMLSRKKQ